MGGEVEGAWGAFCAGGALLISIPTGELLRLSRGCEEADAIPLVGPALPEVFYCARLGVVAVLDPFRVARAGCLPLARTGLT
jgi:hypothetical protein